MCTPLNADPAHRIAPDARQLHVHGVAAHGALPARVEPQGDRERRAAHVVEDLDLRRACTTSASAAPAATSSANVSGATDAVAIAAARDARWWTRNPRQACVGDS